MVSVAQKMTRAFLVGLTIGIIAGLGFYFMTTAINMIVAPAAPVFNPIAMLVITLGFVLVASIAIELSADISAKSKTESSQPLIMDIGTNLSTAIGQLAALKQQGQKKTEDGPPTKTA